MNNRVDLRGQIAFITGAAQGLGYAIAKAYAEQGMKLALMDVKADVLEAVSAELSAAYGVAVAPIPVDLSDAQATHTAIRDALNRFGTPRILIHNAAILINRPLLDISIDAFTREMNVMIQAAFLLTQAVWKPMTEAGGGNIVYVSSRSGIEGFLDESPYVAGKHALEGFMKCMALEGASRNIAVNTITPGMLMHTPMSEITYDAEARKKWVDPYLLTPAFAMLAAQVDTSISGQRLNAWEISTQIQGDPSKA